jgi:hypothetical protein
MAELDDRRQICPHLGLAEDREACFSYPEAAHLCFAASRAAPISLEHQAVFCLGQKYLTCPRFVEPSPEAPVVDMPEGPEPESAPRHLLRAAIAAGVILLFGVLFIIYYTGILFGPAPSAPVAEEPIATATPSPTAILTPTPAVAASSPTLSPTAPLPTPTFAAAPGDQMYTLSPNAADIGWVSSGEDRGNHFGDSFLYAGVFRGDVYQAAFQFDLSSLPRGAPIHYAAMQLTGLRDDRLGEDGAWALRLLDVDTDQDWRRHSFQEIFNAGVLQTLSPILGVENLMAGETYLFELSPAQISILEERISKDQAPRASFRMDGPLTGGDNLFAWDSGHGPKSAGGKVTLILSMGQPPATSPPYDYVVVTSTPTPENVLTAAAIVLQMTADATHIGTPTPAPLNIATATRIPEYLVVVPTPTPENEATARAADARATAEALTTGTPTPLPADAVTATPVPSATPTPTYILITATPTAESVFAAATLSAEATARALQWGAPTPLPPNWATPLVVTSTPTPANAATAQLLAAMAAAQAFTTGTPTATPANMVTATPTPVFVLLDGELPPMTPTPTPTVLPGRMPPQLIGKILFRSDRSGEEEIYVINPDGSGLALLSDRWPYELALQQDIYSADGRFRVFVKDARIDTKVDDVAVQILMPALFHYDAFYKAEGQTTQFNASLIDFAAMGVGSTTISCLTLVDAQGRLRCRGVAYEPAWSPVAEQIAFVSNDSGNDEIWIINRDGSAPLQLTRDEYEWWDKHPSWSPDGTQVVFWSNRTDNQQLWLMDVSGGNLRRLGQNAYNDWDPVWVKYSSTASFEARP